MSFRLEKESATVDWLFEKLFDSIFYTYGLFGSDTSMKSDKKSEYALKNHAKVLLSNDQEIIFGNGHCEAQEDIVKYADNKSNCVDNVTSVYDIFLKRVNETPDDKLFGSRRIIKRHQVENTHTDKTISAASLIKLEMADFEFKTCRETYIQVKVLSKFFEEFGLTKVVPADRDALTRKDTDFYAGKKIAMFADTCQQWMVSLLALLGLKVVIVTIYATLSDEAIIFSLNECKCSFIVVDNKSLARVLSLADRLNDVKDLMIIENDGIPVKISDLQQKNSSINYHLYDTIIEKKVDCSGFSHERDLAESKSNGYNDMVLIMFTSGSTGSPKGVCIANRNIMSGVNGISFERKFWLNHTFPAFLPLAHIFEMVSEFTMIANYGTIGYCRPLTLTDKSSMTHSSCKGDLTLLRPTGAIFVPLLLDRMVKTVLEAVNAQGGLKKKVFKWALKKKLSNMENGDDSQLLDKFIFSKTKDVLGGQLRYVISGGAPLPKILESLSRAIFCIDLKQGYGLTETCCGGSMAYLAGYMEKCAGPPVPGMQVKLVNWEEGGYRVTDRPNPRGEIVFSGDCVTCCYYGNRQLTDEAYLVDEQGRVWFATGDIACMQSDGTIDIVDRKKDIIKLKNGEYVSLTMVEALVASSAWVDFCCVLPNNDSSFLVCLIVANRQKLEGVNVSGDKALAELNDNEEVTKVILHDFQKTEGFKKLFKMEKPSRYVFVEEYWSPDMNLLTPSMKLKRTEIKKFYSRLL